jgi:hypothetical protein
MWKRRAAASRRFGAESSSAAIETVGKIRSVVFSAPNGVFDRPKTRLRALFAPQTTRRLVIFKLDQHFRAFASRSAVFALLVQSLCFIYLSSSAVKCLSLIVSVFSGIR